MDLYYRISDKKSFFVRKINESSGQNIFLSLDTKLDEIQDFLKITGLQEEDFISVPYRNLKKVLGLTHEEFLRSVPEQELQSSLDKAAETLQNALGDKENELYLVTYMCIKKFLRSLSRPSVSIKELHNIKNSIDHNSTAKRVMSLLPDSTGKAPRVVYDMTATSTGRLTVIEGPNILTLPASVRKALKSTFPKGKILQIDLTAAEPRIALFCNNIKSPPDIYSYIADTILQKKVTRTEAKLITLCALYGQSPKKLSEALPSSINPREVIRKTKNFFGSEELTSDLKRRNTSGKLRNILGRPLNVSHDRNDLLISHFLQSSAAEVSILMFSDFCKSFYRDVVPLYVVHDALIFDCTEKLASRLLSKESFTLSLGEWKFETKVTEVNN